ncbi:LysM peptidoglycan-binding domain-containing protein [Listeria rocourtiae]|uniref:LysM peptidoglycan-binding domain-containing protein n=1 Tax=Listeria rocourtiae TaxID=647910 RepID=UPI00162553D3|nr:LysM peptidoglycan-binding domain-containing protein [Listeria rocourtiae]MBC1604105.1 LysM peptidoglycan-binding domain-containing protein [Listeria rocourtiae]
MADKTKKKEEPKEVEQTASTEIKYIAKAGEKLSKIATDNNVTIGHLIALNELSTMVLEESQVVYIQK